jgi:hypothetical protein
MATHAWFLFTFLFHLLVPQRRFELCKWILRSRHTALDRTQLAGKSFLQCHKHPGGILRFFKRAIMNPRPRVHQAKFPVPARAMVDSSVGPFTAMVIGLCFPLRHG